MSDVLTYDPKKNIIIYGGRQLTGFAEDDMITIKPLGDGMQIYSGADGEVGRSVDPNSTFEVKVSLATSSKSNDHLLYASADYQGPQRYDTVLCQAGLGAELP